MMIVRVLAVLAAVSCLAQSATAASLEAYGRLPSIEGVSISPSGHALATITTDG